MRPIVVGKRRIPAHRTTAHRVLTRVLPMTKRSTIESVPRGEYVPTAEQRIVMHGVSWDASETFRRCAGMHGRG